MAFARFRLPLYGLLAGVLLSAMRAPLGLDWTQLAVVDSGAAALFRALALVTLALFLDARRPAFQRGTRPLVLLPAITLGYLAHGLFLDLALQPGCRLGIAIAFVVGSLLMWLVAGRIPGGAAAVRSEEWSRGLQRAERYGLMLAGLGAAVAIETVAQHVRLLGQGLPVDDTVIAGFLLLWTTLMALAFGFSIPKTAGQQGVLSAAALASAAALGVYSLKFLGGLDREGLWSFLKSVPFFELDTSLIGTWPADAWISASALVPIGLGLGIALLGAQHPARLGAMLFGAALGLLLRPYALEVLSKPLDFPMDAEHAWAWQLVALGSALAGIGCLLCARGLRGFGRISGALVGLAAGAAPLVVGLFGPLVVWSFSPWLKFDVHPVLVIPSAVGVISVEPRPDGALQVNADRRRLTPSGRELDVDALRLSYSLALADPALLSSGRLRLLLLGQLTPERDSRLRLAGITRLDRSASWYSAMPSIERELFGPLVEPLGQLIAPGEARRRLLSGAYDLVISLPASTPDVSPRGASGPTYSGASAPILGSLSVPEGTQGVVWVDASAPLHTRALGKRVMLAMAHMEQLSVGIVYGSIEERAEAHGPLLFDAKDPLWPSTIWMENLRLLNLQAGRRSFAPRSALLQRLAQDAGSDPASQIAQGLEQHFALQTTSSPFENQAQALEWSEAIIGQLFGALGSLPRLDPFSRSLGEDLYWMLTEKRLPDMVIVYGEAVAERFAPWPAADRALARAYEELLEPTEALRIWKRLVKSNPYELDDYLRCADAAMAADLPVDAAETLRQALKIQPGRFDLRRALGLALHAAKDPAGDIILRELLENAAEDNLIRAALGMELIPDLDDQHGDH